MPQRLPGFWRLTLTFACFALLGPTFAATAASPFRPDDLQALEDRAAARDPEACFQLARRYERGDGVPRDLHRAATFLERAAYQGHGLAAYTLSDYFASGKHGAVDLVSAYYWLALAIESGQASAQKSFDALSRRMTKAQLVNAQLRVADTLRQREGQTPTLPTYDESGVPTRTLRSVYWTLKAAENGDGELQFKVAIKLLNGYDNFSKNQAAAVRFYRSSAEKGWAPAQYVYGSMCLSDGKIPEGLKWLRAAARQGNVECLEFLAVILSNGQYGVPRNYQESLRWLKLAADQNSVQAQEMLARRYEVGTGTPLDLELAWYWYERAAENEEAECAYKVALNYDSGRTVKKDAVKAYGWYRIADALGYPCAQKALQALGNRLSPDELSTGEQLLTDWKKRHPRARPRRTYSVNCP